VLLSEEEDYQDREFLKDDKDINLKVRRDAPPKIRPNEDSITFMAIDIDYTQMTAPSK
jgi:hypothetical protein